ncbi:MAG: cell surface protein SprA, partial [bacterium]|nr:cell surface protein SprA [bacterium]
RNYNEKKMRNLSNSNMIITPTYNKYFTWNRSYEMKYDLMRALKLDFSVNQQANIDEPAGKLDKSDPFYRDKMDTIWSNVWDFGRMTTYNQTLGVNYQVPLNKIPIVNFISLNTRYNGSYNWIAAPLALRSLGNTIQNSNSVQYNGQINLTTLYNKVPYFKKLNQGNRRSRGGRNSVRNKKEQEENDGKKKKFEFLKHATRFALGVKNISINYSEDQGTFLPGYLKKPQFLGQDWSHMSPGIPFAFGSQKDIRDYAGRNGWITKDSRLNSMYKRNNSENLTLRSTVEPIKQFRIELTANKITSNNHNEYFRWDDDMNNFNSFSPTESGSYSVSFISWGTAFRGDNDDYESKTFSEFRNNRIIIA